jgi:hypothetical protein
MVRVVLPRLGDSIFVVILAGCLVLGARMLNTDSDLGRHLTVGNYILDTHSIPTQDILSFTRQGDSRPPYEWLSQVAFASAYRAWNLDGVVLLTSIAIAAAFTLVFLDSLGRSRSPIIALGITALAAVASSVHWLTRPHVFSFVLFAVWLRDLERLRRGELLSVWRFPILMLIWANAHGGFLFGILAWAAYGAGWLWERVRRRAKRDVGIRLLVVGATSLLASVITPDLWGNWVAVLANRSAYVLNRTAETMPPRLGAPSAWPFLLMLILLLAVIPAALRRLAPAQLVLLGGLAAMSLVVARNIPFFAIAVAPVLTQWLSEALEPQSRWARQEQTVFKLDVALHGHAWSTLAVVAAAAWLSYLAVTGRTPIYQFNPGVFPVDAADWIVKDPPPGNMFNDFNWGGYLLYRTWPMKRVFIDSQSDFYGEGLTRQYEQMILARGNWQEYLWKYGVDWIIVPPKSALSTRLAVDPAWRTLYEDETAIVIARVEVH